MGVDSSLNGDEDFVPFEPCSECEDPEKCDLWDCCQMMIEEEE